MASNNTAHFNSPVLAFAGSAVVTGIWFVALFAIPQLQDSGLSVIAMRIAMHLIFLSGTWAGLSRTSLTPSQRTATWLAISIPLTLWHGTAWAIVAKGLLLLALAMGALTAPGPFQHFAFDHPNLTVGMYPTAIIPAFTVPTSLVLHALSLRQLRRRMRAAAALTA